MSVYEEVIKFKKKYPLSVAWRLKKNSQVVENHLTDDEKLLYAFAAQKNDNIFDVFSTAVIAITSKRIIIGRKRLLFGYAIDSVMPYMYNDMNVRTRIIWGKLQIDTVKELIILTNIDKAALPELENKITDIMYKLKKEFQEEE